MNYGTATILAKDLGFLQVAIILLGGTVTQSRHDIAGNVEVTYVLTGSPS